MSKPNPGSPEAVAAGCNAPAWTITMEEDRAG